MKLVTAVIRPERLEAVQAELAAAQVYRLTVSDVQGISPSGSTSSAAASYAGTTAARPERMVKLEVAVNEAFVEPTVRAISEAGRSGEGSSGDGVVFVFRLEEVIRIRTGERGPEAI